MCFPPCIGGTILHMTNRRSGAQDIAKGMMIISVVFFHANLMTFDNVAEALSTFNILMALFPFLLSAFFFYAGYNYTPNERTYKQNVLRRAKQLLIPLAVAFGISTLLFFGMELAFHHADPMPTLQALGNSVLYGLMSEPLAIMIQFPQNGGIVFEFALALCLLWFLYALFICSLAFYALVKWTNQKFSTFISVIAALLILAFCIGQFVGVYLPYTVQCYPVIVAIMLTGAYLRQHRFLDREIHSKKDIVLTGINMLVAEGIVVSVCLFCYFQFGSTNVGSLPGGQFDPHIKGFDAFVSFGFGILGTYFIHMVSRLIELIPFVGKGLQWVGKHSAMFYLFHPIFLDLTAIVIFQKRVVWGRGQAFFYVAVTVALLVAICLLMDWIKKKKNRGSGGANENNGAPKES